MPKRIDDNWVTLDDGHNIVYRIQPRLWMRVLLFMSFGLLDFRKPVKFLKSEYDREIERYNIQNERLPTNDFYDMYPTRGWYCHDVISASIHAPKPYSIRWFKSKMRNIFRFTSEGEVKTNGG